MGYASLAIGFCRSVAALSLPLRLFPDVFAGAQGVKILILPPLFFYCSEVHGAIVLLPFPVASAIAGPAGVGTEPRN